MPESVNLMEENESYISSRNKVGKYKVFHKKIGFVFCFECIL